MPSPQFLEAASSVPGYFVAARGKVSTPHSKMHFMVTCSTIVNADVCVIFFWQRAPTRHAHFLSAPTRGYAGSGQYQFFN